MGPAEIRSLLKDVALTGVAIVPSRKLLWLLGWGQDRPGAWRDLLDHWKEIGGDTNALYGLEVNDLIILTTGDDLELVSKWANE